MIPTANDIDEFRATLWYFLKPVSTVALWPETPTIYFHMFDSINAMEEG